MIFRFREDRDLGGKIEFLECTYLDAEKPKNFGKGCFKGMQESARAFSALARVHPKKKCSLNVNTDFQNGIILSVNTL